MDLDTNSDMDLDNRYRKNK